MHIVDVLEKFLGQLTADGRSRRTICQYRRHVRTLAAWAADVGHSGRVSEITDEDLARFLVSPQARTSARGGTKLASSLNCLRASVTRFLKHVRRNGFVPENAEAAIRPQPHGPKSGIRVSSYADLDQYVGAFARGHLNLLILVGAPGLQKSKAVRTTVGESVCWIEGHATPFGIYRRP